MSVAPRVMAWQRRMAATPGPLQGASTTPGVPFLTDVLSGALLVVLIRFGDIGSSWTDVSADVIHGDFDAITCTVGRMDENSVAPPAECRLKLKNPDRRYSQFDPLSPNYPYVRENAPLWVRIWYQGQYYTRFYGEIKGFEQEHDTTGNYSVANVLAAGVTRRLAQATAPVESVMRRSIASHSPVGYWPMEDGTDATLFASAVSGGTPARYTGTVTLATDSTMPGSNPLPQLSSSTFLYGDVQHTFTGQWQVDWYFKLPSLPASQTPLMTAYQQPSATGLWYWNVTLDSVSNVTTQAFDNTGTRVVNVSNSSVITMTGQWIHMRLTAQQSGSNIAWLTEWFPLSGFGAFQNSTVAGTVGGIGRVAYFPQSTISQISMGHLAVFDAFNLGAADKAANGYIGETPSARISRLCSENGVDFSTTGLYSSAITMGVQPAGTPMSVMREAERTDSGYLYDGLGTGLLLEGISQRYDQASLFTLDGPSGDLIPPFKPLPDDFGRVNRATVTQTNGSSVVSENTDGQLGTNKIGTYDTLVPVNYQTSDPLSDRASWEVHRGSGRPGFRYPQVMFNLRTIPAKAVNWLATQPGDSFTVNPPYTAQNPTEPVRLVAEGWTETLTNLRWEVTVNCSRQDVYDVFKVADSTLGRLQTGGSTVAASAGVGATTLSVATATGSTPWTTAAGDLPLYLDIAGIQVTVTNITGSSSPQTFTVDPTTVTKPLNPGDPVALWRPGVIAL